MNKTLTAFALPLLMLGHSAAFAQNSNFAIGPKIGTTGLGAEASLALTETVSLRGAYSVFDYDTDFDDTDVRYDAEFDKDSISLLLDWNPGNGGFRISAGAYAHSDNKVSVLATPTAGGTYTFNDNTYNASDIGSVLGSVSFNKTTPYLGIGWGNTSRATGLTFMVDLGVQLQDSPNVVLVSTNCSLPASACAQLNSDLQAEVQELEDDGDDFKMWPVLNVGLMYRF